MLSTLPEVSLEVVGLGVVAACYSGFLLRRWWISRNKQVRVLSPSGEAVIVAEKETKVKSRAAQGPFGEWTPDPFEYPSITPVETNIEDMAPRPYRPFKEGEYHITMGIRKMPFDEWIEPDDQLATYHRIRTQRVAERKEQVVQVLPDRPGVVKGGFEAAEELAHELAEFLSRRYPKVYSVTRHAPGSEKGNGWYGDGRIKEVTILPLGVPYNLDEDEPMKVAGLLTQDDMAIMIEGEDGEYYLQAGAILVPGTWRLDDKIGMPLDEIHYTGEVPLYKENLQPSMTRFFRRLTPSSPVVRNNWTIQNIDSERYRGSIDQTELSWATTQVGAEDAFQHPPSSYKSSLSASSSSASSQGAKTPHTPTPSTSTSASPTKIENLRLRTERQSLRRLPKSGAIVFSVRVYTLGMEELGRERGVPGRLAGAVRGLAGSKGEVAARKRQESYEKELLEYLDGCARAEVE
ncbi:uncharacterized protein STEHIDRAFT_146234 [Stereum hirsutum FP-91666 SS1]|uniref:uncharacterized protein n=1 Tax=Stereum hirsutum (strain FP-91666) TaxID=721885 RepID=UPI000440AE83|nr:uncharacterized protein STEHIDRAFT_146234 [Stereum hirsutum FP-91666 SS1]EIM88152.1 hypothetical protein STEHIDRAFT_146234 [Stereum hirsutum FP-91666 SS1]